jgi:hypothetical protein
MQTARLNLWVHDERFSKQDIVVHPDCLPFLSVGDVVEIYHPVASDGKWEVS